MHSNKSIKSYDSAVNSSSYVKTSRSSKRYTGRRSIMHLGVLLEEDASYDPHQERVIEQPISNIHATIHFVKGTVGAGFLSMADVIELVGIITGVTSTVVFSFIATHCLHILFASQYKICKRLKVPWISYGESFDLALQKGPPTLRRFAPHGHCLVTFLIFAYQIGIMSVYVSYVSETTSQLSKVALKTGISKNMAMAIFLIPFLLISNKDTLAKITRLSLLGNCLVVGIFAIICYYCVQDLPPIGDELQLKSFLKFPRFFGELMFALETIGVVVAVEENMKTPKKFRSTFGVLNVSMFCITTSYILIGFLGCWKYGKSIEPSILRNLPEGWPAGICKFLSTISLFVSFSLQSFVPCEMFWNIYAVNRMGDCDCPHRWRLLVKIGFTLVSFMCAAGLPMLDLIVNIIGSFCVSILGIGFPALIEICVAYPKYGVIKWILIKDVILLVFACIAMVAGFYITLKHFFVLASTK